MGAALVVVLLKVLPLVFKIWFNLQMQRRLIQLGNIEKRYATGDDRSSLSAELDRVDQATAKKTTNPEMTIAAADRCICGVDRPGPPSAGSSTENAHGSLDASRMPCIRDGASL